MSDWADRVVEQAENDYEEGLISHEELNEIIRDVRAELEAEAQENAERAYRDTMGY